MKRKVSEMLDKGPQPASTDRDFEVATRITRQAFIVTMRDLADTRAEVKACLPTGPDMLAPHDATLIRSYLDLMLRGAGALTIGLRLDEAQAVLAAADLIVELSRSEELRSEVAQRLDDYERALTDMRRDIDALSPAEQAALRKLLKKVEQG